MPVDTPFVDLFECIFCLGTPAIGRVSLYLERNGTRRVDAHIEYVAVSSLTDDEHCKSICWP